MPSAPARTSPWTRCWSPVSDPGTRSTTSSTPAPTRPTRRRSDPDRDGPECPDGDDVDARGIILCVSDHPDVDQNEPYKSRTVSAARWPRSTGRSSSRPSRRSASQPSRLAAHLQGGLRLRGPARLRLDLASGVPQRRRLGSGHVVRRPAGLGCRRRRSARPRDHQVARRSRPASAATTTWTSSARRSTTAPRSRATASRSCSMSSGSGDPFAYLHKSLPGRDRRWLRPARLLARGRGRPDQRGGSADVHRRGRPAALVGGQAEPRARVLRQEGHAHGRHAARVEHLVAELLRRQGPQAHAPAGAGHQLAGPGPEHHGHREPA